MARNLVSRVLAIGSKTVALHTWRRGSQLESSAAIIREKLLHFNTIHSLRTVDTKRSNRSERQVAVHGEQPIQRETTKVSDKSQYMRASNTKRSNKTERQAAIHENKHEYMEEQERKTRREIAVDMKAYKDNSCEQQIMRSDNSQSRKRKNPEHDRNQERGMKEDQRHRIQSQVRVHMKSR